MSNTELNQMKAERLQLLGALSEQPVLKAKVDAAAAEFREVLARHEKDGAGPLAMMLTALEQGISAAEGFKS